MGKETDFERKTVKQLQEQHPECIILKLDPNDTQGIPDRLILCPAWWGTLEFKKSADADKQPNQEYYVNRMDDMSFSRFIYPENKEEVLNEIQRQYTHKRGKSRIPRSK